MGGVPPLISQAALDRTSHSSPSWPLWSAENSGRPFYPCLSQFIDGRARWGTHLPRHNDSSSPGLQLEKKRGWRLQEGWHPGFPATSLPLSPTSTASELLSPSPSPLTSRCLWSEPGAHRHLVYQEQRDSNPQLCPSLPTPWLLPPPDAAP